VAGGISVVCDRSELTKSNSNTIHKPTRLHAKHLIIADKKDDQWYDAEVSDTTMLINDPMFVP
jgi:hypothetical protein